MTGVLFLSYTGLLEPLGESQVLAYQERLAQEHTVHIISFERAVDLANEEKVSALKDRLSRVGIVWHPRRYHKWPSALATFWDVGLGTLAALSKVRRHDLEIVHARSYVAGVMALLVKFLLGTRFLFDMRGFWPDERVDGGLWPAGGSMYRVSKWFERKLLLNADHVVSLTHAGVAAMRQFDYLQNRAPPMTVVPTCTSLTRFSPADADRDEDFTLGHVGSVGTWYLFDSAVEAFKLVRRRLPRSRFLVLNRGAHGFIRERLAAAGIPMECVELREVTYAEVPQQMRRMHAGVFFIKPVFSKQASAPTKFAEFLACGIPCLSNLGVGDMAHILLMDRVGVAVDVTASASMAEGVDALLRLCEDPKISERCVASAQRNFSLEEGTEAYRSIYREMLRV